jgi:SAM-dependent methyltransferase
MLCSSVWRRLVGRMDGTLVSESGDWPDYIARFHRDRPGITEALLGFSHDELGDNPYDWLTGGLPGDGLVLDLGCGSGPTAPGLPGWVGLDLSRAELRGAQLKGRTRVVQARAEAVPIRAGRATAVIASMSLMVADHAGLVLTEAHRLLEPGGVIAILLPARDPSTWADRLRYAALLVAVGRRAVPFPHPEVEHDVRGLLAGAGFEVVADDTRRFAHPTTNRRESDLLVDSLYLPGVPAARVRMARRVVRRWGHAEIGIPLRRVIARRGGTPTSRSTSLPAGSNETLVGMLRLFRTDAVWGLVSTSQRAKRMPPVSPGESATTFTSRQNAMRSATLDATRLGSG